MPWWATAVAYQIYPRSFCDTTGSGIGDLEGIRRHLDHVVDLGVDALWLSPFFPSPMADAGYDVADYCDVDPLFGDLGTFDRLLDDAHRRGLKVIIDWVPNHTSIAHPWFDESRASVDSPKRDWYVWRDPAPGGGPPNNWVESLTYGPAWTLDEATGQYYLHCFLPEQPDLNWANPDVVEAMHSTLRFWLDRGVDGFRMDVVHLIGKDPTLPDEPPGTEGLPHIILNDRPEAHELLRGIRRLLDSYDGDRMAIGEVYLLDTERVVTYFGTSDAPELHLCFNFPPMHAPWDAASWRQALATTATTHDARAAWPSWVLSNHDVPRHRTRYATGDERRDDRICRAAATMLLTLRGTPFLYAGEELGLADAVVAPERRVDPGGRDGCRAPVPWTAEPPHGWTDTAPWLPWPPDPRARNAEAEGADDASLLSWYRQLLALRRSVSALRSGDQRLLEDAPEGVVAYRRTLGDEVVQVAINMTDAVVAMPCPEAAEVLAGSDGQNDPSAALAPDEARIIRLLR